MNFVFLVPVLAASILASSSLKSTQSKHGVNELIAEYAFESSCAARPFTIDDLSLVYKEWKKKLPVVQLGNSVYYFSDHELNWYQASEFCRRNQMSLASIESKDEDEHILAEIRKSKLNNTDKNPYSAWHRNEQPWFYVSGSDLGHEGRWVWASTGHSVGFTNWTPDQPDNAGSENCIHYWQPDANSTVGWNNVICTVPLYFICEV